MRIPDSTVVRRDIRAPVVFNQDTLFYIGTRIGPFTAADRARAVSSRLERLATDPLLNIDSIRVIDDSLRSDIVSGDVVIAEITEADAIVAGKERADLAGEYSSIIRSTLRDALEQTSLESILLGALFTVISTIVLIIAFRLINRYFPKLITLLNSWRRTRIPAFRIQKLELLSSERITDIVVGLVKLVRVALIILLLYLYLPLVFGFFPWTRRLGVKLFHYVSVPVSTVLKAILNYLPNLFFILVIVVVTYYIIRFIRLIFEEIERGTVTLPHFYAEWAIPTFKIVRFMIVVLAVVMIFPLLPGAGSDAFQSVSLFVGLLVSLGSASAISNIVAGVVLTYTRAFRIGDRVKIADTVGDVIEKTLLVTRVRTIKNVDITIPNSLVLGSHITNFSSSAIEHGLILHTGVTIGYDVPWQQVHQLLIDAALATNHILKEPVPFVLQKSLDDFYVSYELNAYTNQPHSMARIYSELHSQIQDRFNEAGVEIMSPHYSAVRDGNMSTIPEGHLPKDYKAPGFRLFPFSDLFNRGSVHPTESRPSE